MQEVEQQTESLRYILYISCILIFFLQIYYIVNYDKKKKMNGGSTRFNIYWINEIVLKYHAFSFIQYF